MEQPIKTVMNVDAEITHCLGGFDRVIPDKRVHDSDRREGRSEPFSRVVWGNAHEFCLIVVSSEAVAVEPLKDFFDSALSFQHSRTNGRARGKDRSVIYVKVEGFPGPNGYPL